MKAIGKLLTDAGEACGKHHDRTVRNLPGRRRVQCDELWSFVCAKDKNVANVKPWDKAGTAWTWFGLDTRSKLVVSCLVSEHRDTRSAVRIMRDLKKRLKKVPNIAADQFHASLPDCREQGFRSPGQADTRQGDGTTSRVERYIAKMRMGNRRYVRKANACGKTFRQHVALVRLQTVHAGFSVECAFSRDRKPRTGRRPTRPGRRE